MMDNKDIDIQFNKLTGAYCAPIYFVFVDSVTYIYCDFFSIRWEEDKRLIPILLGGGKVSICQVSELEVILKTSMNKEGLFDIHRKNVLKKLKEEQRKKSLLNKTKQICRRFYETFILFKV